MSQLCLLDQLPVELLHHLFDYFRTNEILSSFIDINDYINAVIVSYMVYQPDFRSVQKIYFDTICRHIRPEEVLSLRLSDDDDTAGQSQLFFSRFQIEQFTRLRSLTLVKIEFETLKYILSSLDDLISLCSLSFEDKIFYCRNENEKNEINQLFFNNRSQIQPRVSHLYLSNDSYLPNLPLSNVRHLKLTSYSDADLQSIFLSMPQLRSLSLSLNNFSSYLRPTSPCNFLIQLNLEVKNDIIQIDEIEYFLSILPGLKHLKLQINGAEDVFDGYVWELLTKNLITFNFKFYQVPVPVKNILCSFRTRYWRKEKNWYVAYYDNYLFSVPYFTPKHINLSVQSSIRSTKRNNQFFYDNISEITISSSEINNKRYFTHINTLKLKCSISLDILASAIDLIQVKYLSVLSFDDFLMYIPLESSIPQLRELSIENNMTIDMILKMRRYRCKQIQKLEIYFIDVNEDYIIEELFRIFPSMQQLIRKQSTQSKNNDDYCINWTSIIGRSDRFRNNHSIWQRWDTPKEDSISKVYSWMTRQPLHGILSECWPRGKEYYWYRLKYLFATKLYPNSRLLITVILFILKISLLILLVFHVSRYDDASIDS